MADEADDVLELDDALELEGAEEGEADPGADEGDDEEVVVGFGDNEAAPASEEQTSTFREVRAQLRQLQRENAELRRTAPKAQTEAQHPGKEPELSDFDYDEVKFRQAVREYDKTVEIYEKSLDTAKERETKEREETLAKIDAYKAEKAKLNLRDFEEAEQTVYAALGDQYFGLLMETENRAALVYALFRDPAKLDQLSKLTPVKAAMLVGKLEEKVTVTKRKPAAQLDQPLRGNAKVSAGSSDRELARLEKEADQTGDRTKLIAYRKSQRAP